MPVPRHAPRQLQLTQAQAVFARLRRPRPGLHRGVALLAALVLLSAPLPLAEVVRADVAGTYTAKLTGTHEVPPNGSTGTGTAQLDASPAQLTYDVTVAGTGTVVGADIHLAAIGLTGPAAVPLPVNADGTITGTLAAGAIVPATGGTWLDILNVIAAGGAYVEVRTAAFPNGEVRGQLSAVVSPPLFTMTAGAPPAGTPARDDYFPRSLTIGTGSIVRFVVSGSHTATLLPTGMTAAADTGAAGADEPSACGTDANPCIFTGLTPLSIGPADPGSTVTVSVLVNAPIGDYVVHSRLQPAMVGVLHVVPPGSFEISSVDDIALAIAGQLGGTQPPPTSATSVYSGMFGYDVSYPDCKRLSKLPATDPLGFAVVGANGGRMFRYNPCLSTLWNWADEFAVRSIYINTNAAAGSTMKQGATGPAGTCHKSDKICYGYNYGYIAARAAWRYAYHQLGPAGLPQIWWLDVEIDNVWYTKPDLKANAAVVQGALDFLGKPGPYGWPSMNYTVGIYSTTYQFQRIAGTGFKPNVPVWYATVEKTHPPSLERCTTPTQRANSFTGGDVWVVQFLPGGTDHNVGCP